MLFWRISQGHWQGTPRPRRAGHRLHLHHVPVAHRADALADGAHRARRALGEDDAAVRARADAHRPLSHATTSRTTRSRRSRRGARSTAARWPRCCCRARASILKDDSAVKLGYVSEANSDPCFPYPEIAQQIAERAGLHGRASRQRAPLAAEEVLRSQEGVSRRSRGRGSRGGDRRAQQEPPQLGDALISLLVGFVVLGIALDIVFPPSSGLPPALTSITKSIMAGNTATTTPAAEDPGTEEEIAALVDVHLELRAAATEVAADDGEAAEQDRHRRAEHAQDHRIPHPREGHSEICARVASSDAGASSVQ